MQKNNFRLKLDTKTVVGSNYSWIKRRQNIIEYLTQFKVRVKNAELSVHTHTHKKKNPLNFDCPFFWGEVGSQTRMCDSFDCPF